MNYEYLIKLKDERKRTHQQIADSSGVPLSTVHRILSGSTESPNIQNVVDIVKALNGSLDEMFGIKPPAKPLDDAAIRVFEQIIEDKKELIAEKNRALKDKDKWIIRLAIVLGLFIAFLIFMIILDRLNGDIGYIRY